MIQETMAQDTMTHREIRSFHYRTNVDAYPTWQAWMREGQPCPLVIWGKYDRSFELSESEAYRHDVPNAQVHVLDASHFALDTAASVTRNALIVACSNHVARPASWALGNAAVSIWTRAAATPCSSSMCHTGGSRMPEDTRWLSTRRTDARQTLQKVGAVPQAPLPVYRSVIQRSPITP